MNNRQFVDQLRGLSQLAIDATVGVTDVVEAMHGTIAAASMPLGAGRQQTQGVTRLVYSTIRGTTRLIGITLNRGLRLAADPAGMDTRTPAWQAALNGVFGDHLVRTDNPLALPMRLIEERHTNHGRSDLLAVHGLCLNETSWDHEGHNHARYLSESFDHKLYYLRYNTGLSLGANGESLDRLLETAWYPEADPRPLDILAHSMGGLVVRSAMACAVRNGHHWVNQVRRVVCLGTPHRGAALEKLGHWVDQLLNVSPYSAPVGRLGRVRSAGITDLRHGLPALPEDANLAGRFFAVAGSRDGAHGSRSMRGDGLVSVASALGFPRARTQQMIARGVGHFDLLSDSSVRRQLAHWIGGRQPDGENQALE